MNHEVLEAARSEGKADLVVRNGRFVNVNTREIYDGGVACLGETVIAIGDVDYTVGEQTREIDAEGQLIVPGFLEGHIHPESSSLSVTRFSEVVLTHGTTSVFTDFHEIGIVRGMDGINAALDEGKETYVRWWWCVPSHIPFNPGLESSGAYFGSETIVPAMDRDEAVGLCEVVSLYISQEHEDLLTSVAGANEKRKSMVGHGPVTYGPDWNGFASIGIANDHESINEKDVLLRARAGIYTHLRHSLVCPTMETLIKTVLDHKIDTRLICLVTDDTNAISLVNDGNMDYLAREAMKYGVDFMTAMQMVTINTAHSFHMERKIGNLVPGRFADILLLSDDTENFRVTKTISKGKVVAENGRCLEPKETIEHPDVAYNTFNIRDRIDGEILGVPAREGATKARVHVMKTSSWIPYTEGFEATVPVTNSHIGCDTAQDILHIAVVERHHAIGNIGRGFLGGFGMKRGAVASSMGHDSHNIVVMGPNLDDMALAVNRVAEIDGGLCLAEDGEIVQEIQMNQYGLLTDLDAWALAEEKQKFLDHCAERGSQVTEVHLFLSFMTIVCIPEVRLSDKGYIDGAKLELKENILGWE